MAALALAVRAEVAGAAGDFDPFDWVAADSAGLAFAFVDIGKSQIGSE